MVKHPLLPAMIWICSWSCISFVDAILGREIKIPTLSGKASLKVPGTHAGQVFRLKGKGFPALKGSQRGDMLVKITIDVPKNLSPKEIELVKQLSSIADNAPKVREFSQNMEKVLKARS
ncbi:MAG: DnaJ C-terminal domain-containing protein [Bdellovibrionales bacterium]